MVKKKHRTLAGPQESIKIALHRETSTQYKFENRHGCYMEKKQNIAKNFKTGHSFSKTTHFYSEKTKCSFQIPSILSIRRNNLKVFVSYLVFFSLVFRFEFIRHSNKIFFSIFLIVDRITFIRAAIRMTTQRNSFFCSFELKYFVCFENSIERIVYTFL